MSLKEKIKVSQMKILEWYRAYNGQVFTSFSGGKDSTVLLDSARQVCPDIPAVYVDTSGLKYPELRDFCKTKDNVIWLSPTLSVHQIRKSTDTRLSLAMASDVISGARKG
ncbi:MAG: phosphoadenosine phosphosulfate reductase family protein [Flavonifractor plautii]